MCEQLKLEIFVAVVFPTSIDGNQKQSRKAIFSSLEPQLYQKWRHENSTNLKRQSEADYAMG